jgi:hypothetical protein
VLLQHEEKKDAPTGVTEAFNLDLAPLLKGNVVLVKLELRDSAGSLVSDNFYWLGGESADYRKLNQLPMAQLAVTTSAGREKDLVKIHVRAENIGNTAAIETKFTLLESDGTTRVLLLTTATITFRSFPVNPGKWTSNLLPPPSKPA